MRIFEEYGYGGKEEYIKNREIADELQFIKSNGGRIFLKLDNNILSKIDHGFILFNKYFDLPITYEEFRNNKITINKQTCKLFKYISSQKEYVEQHGEKLKSMIEEIGRYKFSSDELYLCLSIEMDDILLASTMNSWTSCINLVDGDFKRTVFGNLFNKGTFIAFITNKKEKCFEELKSYDMFLRSFGFVGENEKLYTTLYYPTRTNFEISLEGIELLYPKEVVKAKYNFDIVPNSNGAFVFPYVDKGAIVKVGNNYSFITGNKSDRFEAKVLVDNELLSFEDYYYFGSSKNSVKKHCDICFSSNGIITTINEKNYCKKCLPAHTETCSRCGKETQCLITDKNDYVCQECLEETDNICPRCGTVFPKTRMHNCKFCRSKYLDAYKRYLYYDKTKNNTYTYSKHLLLKFGDLEADDNHIAWDDTQGVYIKI